LLLATRQRSGNLPAALAKPREQLHDERHGLANFGVTASPTQTQGASLEILVDRERRKQPPPLRHVHDPKCTISLARRCVTSCL
jgi:hypothetical protein